MEIKKGPKKEHTFIRVYLETHKKLKELSDHYRVPMTSLVAQIVDHQYREVEDVLGITEGPILDAGNEGPGSVENG